MPLKKKTRTSTTGHGKHKTKQNFVFKEMAAVGPTARTKPLVSALKENNRCLAAALDHSRHEYRLLQENFLQIQEERQKLLEKVASLESQLLKQDLQQFAIYVEPSLQLLDQAENDIKYAKQYLKRLCTTSTTATGASNIPEFLSPIQDFGVKKQDNNQHEKDVKIASEAEVHTSKKGKAVYPKTPHPDAQIQKSRPLSSTPLVESITTPSPILTCLPRTISFEESSQPCEDNNIPKDIESVATGSHQVEASPSEGSQAQVKKCNNAVIVSPGLPEDEDLRTKSDNLSKLDNLHSDLNTTDRPRRRCTSMNMSYQEPSLRRKLTSVSTGVLQTDKPKNRVQHGTQKTVRSTLKDLTNKK